MESLTVGYDDCGTNHGLMNFFHSMSSVGEIGEVCRVADNDFAIPVDDCIH